MNDSDMNAPTKTYDSLQETAEVAEEKTGRE
jgi:hypothetical protein